jgi:hypothetical protein
MPVTLTPTFGPDGTLVTATGCGFTPGSQVMVSWDNEEPLAFTTVNPDGTFTVSFTVPTDAEQGPYQLVFVQSCSGSCMPPVATSTFTVIEG